MGKRLGFSNRVLVVTFVILCIIIVALVIAIIFIKNHNMDSQSNRQEKWNNAMSCLGKNDSTYCDSIIESLEEQTQKGNSIEDRVDAYQLLATLKIPDGDNAKAIALLNEGLQIEGLQDNHKLSFYKALLDRYQEIGDTSAEIDILEKIVSMPDNLQLEYEDWSIAKPYYLQKLEKLRNESR